MNFEIIDEREGHINDRGYRLVKGAEQQYGHEIIRELESEYGINYVDNLFDDFYDGWNKICRGDDGKLYAVDFQCVGHLDFAPLIWQEAEQIEEVTACM